MTGIPRQLTGSILAGGLAPRTAVGGRAWDTYLYKEFTFA